jgi:hypothetical protein
LLETHDKNELQDKGEYYSNLFDVVKSKNWANLKPERGEGGCFIATPESIAKVLETKKKNNTLNTNTSENRDRAVKTRQKNGTLNTNTAESIKLGQVTKSANGSLARSPECVSKMLDTRKINGTLNTRTANNISKQRNTIQKFGNNNFIKSNPSRQKKNCPHCNKLAGGGNFKRWHGDNCKLKSL